MRGDSEGLMPVIVVIVVAVGLLAPIILRGCL